MDQITEAMDMVDHIHQPAFCVREGIIVKANPAAQARMIEAGTPVSQLFCPQYTPRRAVLSHSLRIPP